MSAARVRLSADAFIRERMVLTPLPFCPDISLYRPTPRSGLVGWLAEQGRADDPPYWAYSWAGGAVLAVHLATQPELVAGKTVLDFGSGGGLVAIAAAKAGATVTAWEPDPIGRAAIAVNAEANGAEVAISQSIADAEVILAGDVFYDATIAAEMLPALLGFAVRGKTVLVGDPFRRDLPLEHLTMIAEYEVPDFGSEDQVRSGLFALKAPST